MEQEEETAAARARGDSPPVPASEADAKALADAAVCNLYHPESNWQLRLYPNQFH